MTKFQKKKCLEAAEQKTSKLLVVVCCCKTVEKERTGTTMSREYKVKIRDLLAGMKVMLTPNAYQWSK